MKKTIKTLKLIWISSLFLSPIIGIISILILSYYEISKNIEWDATFTGKSL